MAFARRLAILPGGLGGIGSITGKKLLQQGSQLAILYAPFEAKRRDELLETGYRGASNIDNIRTYECDITSAESVTSAFEALKQDFVTRSAKSAAFPSILINTAGYVSLSDMESTPPEETVKHLHVNVLGPMLCSQAFARLYFSLSSKEEHPIDPAPPPPPGRIVNISSQAAHVALHRHGAYCASKAALLGLTRSMASEWAGRGITCNSVSPTVAWTALGQKAWGEDSVREAFLKTIPTGKFALPEEVADAILFLCQDSSGMINGADLRVDGGFTIR